MKKVIKLIVPFLVAVSACSLAGCSHNGGSSSSSSTVPGPVDPGELVEVTSISLNRANVSLSLTKNAQTGVVEGDTFQLGYETLPRTAIKAKISYSSSNEGIATVDSSGKITAVSAGDAVITAKSFDGKVTQTCRVFVYENISKSAANKAAKKITTAQTEQQLAASLDKIYIREMMDSYLLKDGNLANEDKYDQYLYVGKNDAYLRIGAKQEKQIKVEDGSASFTDWEWIFYTTANYDTYLFHTKGNTKTYMVADSTSFVGQSRFAALCSVCDSFFTSGSSILTSQYDDVIGKKEIGYVGNSSKRGSNKDGELYYQFATTYKNQIADIEDESDMNIPAGTKYDLDIAIESMFVDNLQYAKKLVQSANYTKDGSKYSDVYDIEYEYHSKDVEFFYPNRADYVEVSDIFEL